MQAAGPRPGSRPPAARAREQGWISRAGHSQGGEAIAAGADPIVDTTIPIQPGPQGRVADLQGPAFFVAGQFDWIVPSFYVQSRYFRATPS